MKPDKLPHTNNQSRVRMRRLQEMCCAANDKTAMIKGESPDILDVSLLYSYTFDSIVK